MLNNVIYQVWYKYIVNNYNNYIYIIINIILISYTIRPTKCLRRLYSASRRNSRAQESSYKSNSNFRPTFYLGWFWRESMKYVFYYMIIIFVGKLINKSLKTLIYKLNSLTSAEVMIDWMTARVLKRQKFWAPVCWRSVVLELSPLGN